MGTNYPVKLIIFFDGVCNLCNQWVLFVIRNDKKVRFNFAPLQSAYAQHHLAELDSTALQLNSIILQKNHTIYKKSRAVLEIVRHLSGCWPLLYVFRLIPAPVSDWVYDWVANHRYQWFGKNNQCMVPSPDILDRFVG
ncbi:MAG: thiol-disulfide oxidoreductase DCC family protein [Flammeovirgaceae bacterium]